MQIFNKDNMDVVLYRLINWIYNNNGIHLIFNNN